MIAGQRLLGTLSSCAGKNGVATTVGIWVAFVAIVTLLASFTARASGKPDVPPSLLHGFIASVDEAPPLARWDSIWFYGIAAEGYFGTGPDSKYTPAFLPLYPLLMRALAVGTGLDYFAAGLWISRFALLGVLALLPIAVNDCHEGARLGTRAVQSALLGFPAAFLLAAVYTESLFLVLTLSAFVLARRDYHACAAGAAFAASLTRLHGLALVPAFIALAWCKWRDGKRTAWVLAPALASAMAYIALGTFFWRRFGDPFRYLTAKREGWGTRLALPWETLDNATAQLMASLTHLGPGTLLKALELPAALLIVCTIGAHWNRRNTPEMLYGAFGLALSLFSGLLWGLPRFTLVLFPVFIVLSSLGRRRFLGPACLVAAAVVQVCLLVNFVNFGRPAP